MFRPPRPRRLGTLSNSILSLLGSKPPPVLHTSLASFPQLSEHGPASCKHKQYPDTSIKEVFNGSVTVTTSQVTGLFGNPLLTTAQGYYQFWHLCKEHCDSLVSRIVSSEPSVQTVALFDELSNTVCLFADCIKFVSENHTSKKIIEMTNVVNIEAHRYVENLNINQDLYHSLKTVLSNSDIVSGLNEESLIALKSLISEMELSGISLDEETRKLYVNDNEAINEAGSKFVSLGHQPTLVPKKDLPRALRDIPKQGSFGVITGSGIDHPMDDVRELCWKRYHGHDELKENHLLELLRQRQDMARRLGYRSFADREVKHTMAGSVQNVSDFLTELHEELKPCIKTELDHLKYNKADDVRGSFDEPVVYPWCARYYCDKMRTQFLTENHLKGDMYSDLLNVGNVMEGMGIFCEDVFGVSLVPEIPMRGEMWDKDVVKLAVYDETEGLIGYIYCDFYIRPHKEPRTCLHTITCGTKTQLPVVVLQCSFPRLHKGTFSYPKLSVDQIQTLFHEFGHALHAIFGRTTYQHTSGTRGPTDFSEIPSTLMENFISHPAVYSRVVSPLTIYNSLDFKFGNTLLFNSAYQALETETNIFYGMLDQRLHSSDVLTSTVELSERVQEQYSHIPVVAGTAWHHRFSHLYYYGARYYSYIWSRSVANLIFYNMFYEDPLNEAAGRRLKKFLMQGSSVDYKRSLDELVGYEFDRNDMIGAIVEPIKMFNNNYLEKQDIGDKWW